MIQSTDIKPVGKFLKPHGINGEITLLRDFDDVDFDEFSCIIVDVDGIYVPFFLTSVRPKGAETDIVGIDGITDEMQAGRLTNKTVYVSREELAAVRRRNAAETDGEDSEDGFFADDFIGYEVSTTDGRCLGKIVDVDDSTSNYLFVVETPDGDNLLIPIAEEFFEEIDAEGKHLTLSLPDGLLSL